MLKRVLLIGSLMLLTLTIGYQANSLISNTDGDVKAANAETRSIEDIQAAQGKPVKVGSVTQQDLALSQTFYGTIRPFAEANVQGKYSGQIVLLKGQEGDSVKAGEVIVKFDQKDLQLQLQQAQSARNAAQQSVKQAESNFQTAQKTTSRHQELLKDGFVAKQTMDEIQNQLQAAQAGFGSAKEQVKTAEAQIQILKNMLKDLTITAPISGIIDEKHFNLNEISDPKDVIYHIVDIHQVYVEVEVPETYISQIKEGMSLDVLFDSLNGQQFTGVIAHVIPTGNAASRNFIAKVLVDNPDQIIKPGMFARVNVCLESIPNALVVNKKAVLKEQDQYYVFKVANNQAEKVRVNVKHRDENSVAVLSDQLTAHDQIVVEGAQMLTANDRVRIL